MTIDDFYFFPPIKGKYFYDKFKISKNKFGFELDSESVDKGTIYIYYNSLRNRKMKSKLQWDETENKWKITKSLSINRVGEDRFFFSFFLCIGIFLI